MSEQKELDSLDAHYEESGIELNNNDIPFEIPQSCWLDVTQDIEDPVWLVKCNGVGFAPLGDIQMLRGQEGNGKSFYFTILIATVLRGDYGCYTCDIPDAKVLYIDTEQHRSNSARLNRRVNFMCGLPYKEPNPRFQTMTLREVDNVEDVQKYFWAGIKQYQPKVVFLDGVADLVNDINDRPECQDLVRAMMKEASQRGISIFSVQHTNYGSEKMQGHLGTLLAHKASDIFSCQKDKTQNPPVFTVEQVKARNKDVEKIQFIIDDSQCKFGIPVVITTRDLDADTPTNRGERDELMKEILQYGKHLSMTALINEIVMKRFTAGSESGKRTARLWFEQAKEWGIIVENTKSHHYYYVGLKPFEEPGATEQELPY